MYINLGELYFNVRYETYHMRILFFERYVRTLTYSILAYAYPQTLPVIHLLIARHVLPIKPHTVVFRCSAQNAHEAYDSLTSA